MTAPNQPTGTPAATDPNTQPSGPGTGGTGGDGGTGNLPASVPNQPAAFDPKSLSPEAQAYLREQIAASDLKARTTSKANAAKDATEALTAKLALALGLAPDATKDPDALARQLKDSQIEARALRVDTAIEKAARRNGGDEDLVSAWLAKHARTALKELDPTSATFDDDLTKLVKKTIEDNPRLRAESGTAAPAARGGTTSTAMAGPGAAAAQGGSGETDPNSMSVDQLRKLLYNRT